MSLITITQSTGCGGETIAKRVADSLNLEIYDDSKLQSVARNLGKEFEDLKHFDEKAPGFFDRLISNKPGVFLDLMEAVVYEVAKKGEGIIIGHGGQFLLRDFNCALHVFIFSSRSNRIRWLIGKQDLSREAAQRIIQKSDDNQAGFFRYAFHREWNDPSLFDLVISTGKMTQDSVARLIVEAARCQEVETCSLTALEAMERLSLEKKIEAALLKNSFNLWYLHVEVPAKGVVSISGLADSNDDLERLRDIIKAVEGVVEVQSDVSIKPTSLI